MPVPNDLVLVNPTTPVKTSGVPATQLSAPKDLTPVFKTPNRTISTPGTGLDVVSNKIIGSIEQPLADTVGAKIELAPINDDERDWLKQNRTKLSVEQFDHSLNVFSGNAPGSNFITKGNYYFDADGLPQQIKFGEAAPPLAHLGSIWGSQHSAEDDSWLTTFAKTAYNGLIDIIKLPATVEHLFADVVGLDENNLLNKAPNDWDKFVKNLQFETSSKSKEEFLQTTDENGKPFANLADQLSAGNFHFNSQNIAGAIGSAVGMIGQMLILGGGGEAAGLAEKGADEGLTITQKLAPFAKKTGANTLFMLNSTYDEATRAGLKGHERFAVSLISAVGQGMIMTKLFPELPAGAINKEAQQAISKSAVEAFVKQSGGELTPEALQSAFSETLANSAKTLPGSISKLSKVAKQGLTTGAAMIANHAFDNGVLSLDAHLTGRTDENAVFSPKAFAEYFNSFVSGFAMGAVGGAISKDPQAKNDAQSKIAYAYIKEGREGELIHNLDGLLANNQLTPEQHADAILRVNSYKRYNTETANIKLNDEGREKVFNNIFLDEKVKQHIATLEGDTTMTPAIREAQIKVLRSESTGYVNEIAAEMGRKATPKETLAAAEASGEELPGDEAKQYKAGKEKDAARLKKEIAGLRGANGEVAQENLETFRSKQNELGQLRIEAILPSDIALLREKAQAGDTEAQARLDENKIQWKNETEKKLTKTETRAKIANDFIKANPEYVHHTPEVENPEHGTETLAGGETIAYEGKKAKERIYNGQASAHDKTELDRLEARNNLKPGDVLHVHRFLPETGKRIHIKGRVKALDKGYKHLLNAFDEKGNQVGSVEYQANNENLINDILDKGHDVKLVVTANEKGKLEYRVLSKQSDIRTPEEIRAEHTVAQGSTKENPITGRDVHDLITGHLRGRTKIAERVNKRDETISEDEIDKIIQAEAENETVTQPKAEEEQKPASEEKVVSQPKEKSPKKTSQDQKAKKELLNEEPKTFEQSVLQALLQGMKISQEHIVRNMGKKVAKEKFMFAKKNGQQTDLLNEAFDLEKFGIKDNQDAENELFDILRSHSGKVSMLARLIEISAEHSKAENMDTYEALRGIDPESADMIDKSVDEIAGDENTIPVNDALVHLIDTVNPSMSGLDSIQDFIDLVEKNKDQFDKDFYYDESDYEKIIKILNDEKEGSLESKYGDRIKEKVIRDSQAFTQKHDGESDIEEGSGEEIKYQTSEIVKEIEKNLAQAKSKLESAKKTVISKRAELSKGKLADNEDLFGQRQSQSPENIFDERATGDIEKILQPQKDAVAKLESQVEKLKTDLEKAKSDDSQTELQFQSDSPSEKPASHDTELQQHILGRLAKLFPKVSIFTNADEFQSFLDRNNPGAQLDLSKLGAAVKNAIYINPKRAVQSTAVHEFAHIYWDSLPHEPIKEELLKLFKGNEEDAISAIGKLGTKAAEIGLRGSKLTKFLEAVKLFWNKVKNAFGVANEKDLTKIFADKIWTNKDDAEGAGLKFQSKKGIDISKENPDKKYYRGINKSQKGEFYSEDKEVASNYSMLKVGDVPNIKEVTGADFKGLFYDATNKEDLAEELGIDSESVYDFDFDSKVEKLLQRQGYSGVRYSDGTFEAEEIHVFKKTGNIKFQSQSHTPAQAKTISQIQSVADKFDYNAYKLKGADTEFKPVNDILEGDKKYSYKGKSNSEASERGVKLHSIAEALVRGIDFEQAVTDSGLKFSPEAKEQFRTQVNQAIETLRGKGTVLPETMFANSYFKTAGRADLPIIDKNGTLHIYDFKTSTISTEENPLYEKASGQKAAKKDRDGVQLAMYAKLAEHGDASLGFEPQTIGEVGIIPIRLTIGADGEISKVTVEKTVDVPYDNYRDEARRLLSKQHKDQGEADAKEFKHTGAKSKSQWQSFHGVDIAKLEDELVDATPERAEEIYQTIENAEAQYKQYQADYQKVKNLEDADLSKYSYEELIDTINTINSYDSLLHNIAMKSIQVEAGRRMTEIETERLAKKGVKAGPEKDLSDTDVFFKALSDVSETLPALQGRVRDYFSARQAEETEHAGVDRQAKSLFAQVIKDNGGDWTKSKKDISKFFDNLFVKKQDADGPAVLKDWKDLSNNLKPSERAVLKFMDEKMSEFQKKQALSERGVYDGFYAAISPNFWETYHRHGFLKAVGASLRQDQPEELGEMMVSVSIGGEKKTVTYDEAEKLITESGKKNILTKAAATLKLTRAYAEAKKQLDLEIGKRAGTESAITVRGAASRYTLNDNGEMVSKFNWKRPEGKEISYDVYRSFMSYMTDAIHIKHMQPLLPELTALQAYYKERGVNPNVDKFMQHWIEGDVFGKEFVGQFGRGVDAGVKFLQAWTYYNVMSFNPTVGFFNWTTGKLNQFRSTGLKKSLAKGEPRYWKSPTKTQGILQHYTVVEPAMHGPAKYSAHNIWQASANGFVSMGENMIRGAAFLSHLTDSEWKSVEENFDNKGNIIDKSKDLAPGRVFQIKKLTEDVQGKYSFMDKRMYKHYGIMSAMMGFKGWMPDWLKERFGGEYTDMYGQKHKGSWRSAPYIFRDMKQVLTNWNSENIDVQNNQKNIRGIMTIAVLMGVYATTHGGADEKKKGGVLLTMANDLMGIMNISRTKSTIAKPFPFMGTVTNFVDTMMSLTEFYAREGTYGNKGDWMFPGKALNVLPYNHIAKSAISLAQ